MRQRDNGTLQAVPSQREKDGLPSPVTNPPPQIYWLGESLQQREEDAGKQEATVARPSEQKVLPP